MVDYNKSRRAKHVICSVYLGEEEFITVKAGRGELERVLSAESIYQVLWTDDDMTDQSAPSALYNELGMAI